MLSSPHRDVLEGKQKLVEEIKSRGRAAVSGKAWPDAAMLYQKAVTLAPTEAALHANLSLVQFQMGKWEEAREAAQLATEKDPQYVKGFWRLGQALVKLHRLKEALMANKAGLQLDPNNKAFRKECTVLEKRMEEEEALMEANPVTTPPVQTEPAEPLGVSKKTETTSTSKPKTTKTPASKTTPPATAAKKDTTSATDEEGVFTKSDHVKGYKVVNGKKTSYFHNELSDDARRLIGDIAPKRIDTPAATEAPAPAAGGSAWNKAGTWEEKDVSKWARTTLEQALLDTTYILPPTSPAPDALVVITKVSKLDGHASFAVVRGKKRYIYEYAVEVEWEWKHQDQTATGSMTFPDVDGTCELGEGYDMTGFQVKDASSSGLMPLLDRFVKNGGLRESLHNAIDDWVRVFRETY